MIKQKDGWMRKHISGPAHKMIHKGKSILQSYYIESGEAQKAVDRMIDEDDNEPDMKLEYLHKLGIPDTNEHKQAVSKVKGVISNYKYTD